MRAAAALLVLLLVTMAPPASAQGAGACETPGWGEVICRWTWEARGVDQRLEQELPAFPITLASVNVALLRSPDTGWEVKLYRNSAELADKPISTSTHPARSTTALRHEEATTHVFVANETDRIILVLEAGWAEAPMAQSDVLLASGTFEVTYIARAVRPGAPPDRPAATAEVPQLPDESGEVEHDAWDIQAAWWDDASPGDGLMEAYVKLASLQSIPSEAFDPPAGEGMPLTGPRWLMWKSAWTVLGTRYFVEWTLPRDGASTIETSLSCLLRVEAATREEETVLAHPLCEVDVASGVLKATLPTASIGGPPNGELFTDPAARTRIDYALTPQDAPRATPDVVDHAETEAFLFALGGPQVWDELNGCRFCPPQLEWYEDPLAPHNAADTLQVLGSIAALATFIVGLVLVWRRRRATSRLLARVDAVAEQHQDQRAALLALGRLEEEFSGLFRRHRISEGQYQVLSQRIATVATRFALRTSLGLDDGVPGEDGPTSVRIRKV